MYLDHAATTPTDPRVLAEMAPFWSEFFGNPSSRHRRGLEAQAAVSLARERVARFLGAEPGEIFFTSGGTEADNWALRGLVDPSRGDHLIVSAVEHHAIGHTAWELAREGASLTVLPVDGTGRVDPDEVRRAIRPETVLVSVMLAQNEIGTLQPIPEIAQVTREAGVPLHSDAVAAAGQLPIAVNELGVDLLSISAHKIYGPKGVGVLFIRKGLRPRSLITGGDQEGGRRAGTENVPGVVGLGMAADLARIELRQRERRLRETRDALWEVLREVEGFALNGHPVERVPANLSFSLPDVSASQLLVLLDRRGIEASAGSACAAGTSEVSEALRAVGLRPERARGTVRLTVGKDQRPAEARQAAAVIAESVEILRRG